MKRKFDEVKREFVSAALTDHINQSTEAEITQIGRLCKRRLNDIGYPQLKASLQAEIARHGFAIRIDQGFAFNDLKCIEFHPCTVQTGTKTFSNTHPPYVPWLGLLLNELAIPGEDEEDDGITVNIYFEDKPLPDAYEGEGICDSVCTKHQGDVLDIVIKDGVVSYDRDGEHFVIEDHETVFLKSFVVVADK